MKLTKILLGMVVTILLTNTFAFAQFEGQITMNLYSDSQNGSEVSEVNIYTTAERVLIKGEESYSLMGGVEEASGILIRSDMRDFIVMTGEKEALQFTKEELEGLFSMAGMMNGGNEPDIDSSAEFEYTGRTQTINGYETTELLISSKEKEEDTSMSVWLTGDIDINWGSLMEPWTNAPESMSGTLNRVSQEFKSQNFPMLVEVHDKKGTNTVMEVITVNKSKVAKAMVEIPAETQLMSIQEMMFKMMMGN
ncbi:MAG: DUF4412 domain-containing protein [Balneolales bacterium]|nr:DUF4412 domain-containing protein [Balneolales bacterium]